MIVEFGFEEYDSGKKTVSTIRLLVSILLIRSLQVFEQSWWRIKASFIYCILFQGVIDIKYVKKLIFLFDFSIIYVILNFKKFES